MVAVFKSVKNAIVNRKCQYLMEGFLWWTGEGFVDVTEFKPQEHVQVFFFWVGPEACMEFNDEGGVKDVISVYPWLFFRCGGWGLRRETWKNGEIQ